MWILAWTRRVLYRGGRFGAYASRGAGLSWKRLVLLEPSSTYNYGYGYYSEVASQTSFQPALDANGGITYMFHRNGMAQLYVEARYVKMFTPEK